MRKDIVGLKDGDGAKIQIVTGDHNVMPKSGPSHRLMLKLQTRRSLRAIREHQRVMQSHLDRDASIDEATQLGESFVESAFMVLFPVAAIAERLRGVLPDFMERARTAIECRRTPNRRPAKREAISGRAVREQYVALAMQTEHSKHPGKVASARIATFGIALRAHPGHRIICVAVRFHLG